MGIRERSKYYIVFDGKNSYTDLHLVCSGEKSYKASGRRVETFTVPGRNGDLVWDDGSYDNDRIAYTFGLTEKMKERADNVCSFFLTRATSYYRLESSYHPTYYRMARVASSFDPDVTLDSAMTFGVEFDCLPQKYLLTGEAETEIAGGASAVFTNPTGEEAKPLIKVISGTGTFQVGNTEVTVAKNNGGLIIDCESLICREGTESRDSSVSFNTGEFPGLKASGATTVSVPSGMTVKLTPRWWFH